MGVERQATFIEPLVTNLESFPSTARFVDIVAPVKATVGCGSKETASLDPAL